MRHNLPATLLTVAASLTLACGSSAAPGGVAAASDITTPEADGQVADCSGAGCDVADVTVGGDVGLDADDGGAGEDTGSDGGAADVGVDVAAVDAGNVDISGPGCVVKCEYNQVCELGKCVPLVLPCNGACTDEEYCDQSTGPPGLCTKSGCTLPDHWGPSIQKVSEFLIAATSQGCDLDGDGKPNNVVGNLLKVYPAANDELTKSIQQGLFNMVLEAPMYNTNGAAFTVAALMCDLDPSNLSCSPVSDLANCSYKVDDENYKAAASGTCPPQVLFTAATVKSGQLAAGGQGQTFTITLPIVGGLKLTVRQATLQGQVQGDSVWTKTTSAKICGVITEHDLNKAIEVIPAEDFKTIGLSKDQVKSLLGAFLKPDMDTNADGVPDALSTTMLFKTVPGKVTGIQY